MAVLRTQSRSGDDTSAHDVIDAVIDSGQVLPIWVPFGRKVVKRSAQVNILSPMQHWKMKCEAAFVHLVAAGTRALSEVCC